MTISPPLGMDHVRTPTGSLHSKRRKCLWHLQRRGLLGPMSPPPLPPAGRLCKGAKGVGLQNRILRVISPSGPKLNKGGGGAVEQGARG